MRSIHVIGDRGVIRLVRAALVAVPMAVSFVAAPAAAANQLLETLNVDTSQTTFTNGTVQLSAGTQYQLVVSGTFTLANGFGQSYTEDPLYCYGDSGFDTPQCTPPTYMADFYVGVGTKVGHADAFQTPGGASTSPAYSPSHSYTIDFYPPASGVLTAGGELAYSQCKSGPSSCSTQVSGTVTIQVFGPSTPPAPTPSTTTGWVIGGGTSLQTWPTFCRVQRGLPPARDGSAAASQATGCVQPQLVTAEQESELRGFLRDAVVAAAWLCFIASENRDIGANSVLRLIHYKVLCEVAMQQVVQAYNLLLRIRYAQAANVAAVARPAARCPPPLSASQCATLANYQRVVAYTASVTRDLAAASRNIAAAVKAHDPLSAFFQEAFAKVNEGVLASDLHAEQLDGRAMATLLRPQQAVVSPSVQQAEVGIRRLPSSVLPAADRGLLLAQLSSTSGTIAPSVLGRPLPSSAFAGAYQSIGLRDLASLVNGFVHLGQIPLAAGQKLGADLAAVSASCTDPTNRIAAMKQFVADAQALAGSDAAFLKQAAQPLLTTQIPGSSCM